MVLEVGASAPDFTGQPAVANGASDVVAEAMEVARHHFGDRVTYFEENFDAIHGALPHGIGDRTVSRDRAARRG